MKITIQKTEPVKPVVQKVTLVLSDREAQVLKHVGNFSRRVATSINDGGHGRSEVFRGRLIDSVEIDAVLARVWRHLKDAGVVVK